MLKVIKWFGGFTVFEYIDKISIIWRKNEGEQGSSN